MLPASQTVLQMPWIAPPIWKGSTAFLLGGGPSLSEVDLDLLRGRNVIVINRTFRLAPWAPVLYFCDRHWWTVDGKEVIEKFGGLIVTISQTLHPRVKVMRNVGHSGMSLNPSCLKHGTNSGYQAINLAYHFGVKRIVLLGYDMKVGETVTHAHGGYGMELDAMQHVLQKRMLPYFPLLVEPLRAAGVEVINATEGTALECFPKMSLSEVLKTESAESVTIASTGEKDCESTESVSYF